MVGRREARRLVKGEEEGSGGREGACEDVCFVREEGREGGREGGREEGRTREESAEGSKAQKDHA